MSLIRAACSIGSSRLQSNCDFCCPGDRQLSKSSNSRLYLASRWLFAVLKYSWRSESSVEASGWDVAGSVLERWGRPMFGEARGGLKGRVVLRRPASSRNAKGSCGGGPSGSNRETLWSRKVCGILTGGRAEAMRLLACLLRREPIEWFLDRPTEMSMLVRGSKTSSWLSSCSTVESSAGLPPPPLPRGGEKNRAEAWKGRRAA